MFAVSGAVRASRFSPSTPRRASCRRQSVPISYSIQLRPDAESLALPGVEVIDIEVREPTARLTLNAVNTIFCFGCRRRRRGARRRRARCRGRDVDLHFRAAARRGHASAAHRVRITAAAEGLTMVSRPAPPAIVPRLRRANDGARRTILAKRCLAPAFPIAIAVWTFPLEAYSFHG